MAQRIPEKLAFQRNHPVAQDSLYTNAKHDQLMGKMHTLWRIERQAFIEFQVLNDRA